MKYEVTLAIPVYNVEAFVEKSLLSALNQSFESIEFVLVDDKGQDESMNIVRRIVAAHPRKQNVRIIEHAVNIGLGAARNTAIDNAKGKYVFFMDSDDEITPDCIALLYQKMQETPVDFVRGSIITTDMKGCVLSQQIFEDKIVAGNAEIVNEFYADKSRKIQIWNELYNLAFLRTNGIRCLPDLLYEDVMFRHQVVLNATSYRRISNATYLYCIRMGALTTAPVNEKFGRDCVEIIKFIKNYTQRYSDMRVREMVFRWMIFQSIFCIIRISNSTILSPQTKRPFLKQLVVFPLPFSEIKRFGNKKFFYLMWLAFKLPVCWSAAVFNLKEKMKI
jgi:glycosyltransferase involved in cell wall biosynthesis